MILSFADIEIDPDKGEVRRGGDAVHVAPRVVSLLHLLAANSDRIVTKDEIVERVWDGRAISDSAISTTIKELRQAIGDSGTAQALIRTVHGRGFRCVAEVRLRAAAHVVSGEPAPGPDRAGPHTRFAGMPTVAVLPFGNLLGDGAIDPLGDGLAAELISALSRLGSLLVTARGSSFRFRQAATDLNAVRDILGARYCLSGLVETSGPQIVITVELARTEDGVVIWSDRFSGLREQVHDFRGRIVADVINALEMHVPINEAQTARLLAPGQLDAWAEYHIGLQHLYRFNRRDTARAKALFESAVAREPGFARAHAGLSFVAFQGAFMGYEANPARHREAALIHAQRSLELDLLDPFANYCMGRATWMSGDLDAADTWLGRSLEISPNFAHGHYLRSLVRVLKGQGQSIRDENRLAMRLSPLDPLLYAMLGTQAQSYINEEDFDRAADWSEKAVRAPGSHYLLGMLAAASQQLRGDHDRARHWVASTRARRPDVDVARFLQAFQYQSDKSRERIERALTDAGF